jgi:hypothetical protein
VIDMHINGQTVTPAQAAAIAVAGLNSLRNKIVRLGYSSRRAKDEAAIQHTLRSMILGSLLTALGVTALVALMT